MEKRQNKKIFGLIFALSLFFVSCAATQQGVEQGKDVTAIPDAKSVELLTILKEINGNSPDTIRASFTADGDTSGKKFRLEGKALFDKKGYYSVSLTDYVFKSPVMNAYRELDRLYFYYPAEKKLLADDINKIDFYRYSGFKADFGFMQTLFTGGIPVIINYSVNKVLREGESSYFLILENKDYFENIFFSGGIPEKILLIHKQSRDKAEIYLKSMTRREKSIFYRSIRIVAPGLGVTMQISFSKPVLNEPVKVETVEPVRMKKGVQLIKVN